MTAVVRAFRRGEWRTSLDTAALPGTEGASYGLALVPEIVAHADRRWWDTTRATLQPLAGRRELLLEAVELFGRGTVTAAASARRTPSVSVRRCGARPGCRGRWWTAGARCCARRC